MRLGNVDIGFVGALYEKQDLLNYKESKEEIEAKRIKAEKKRAEMIAELTSPEFREKMNKSFERNGIPLRMSEEYIDGSKFLELSVLGVKDIYPSCIEFYRYRNMTGRRDMFQNNSGQQWLAFSKCLYDNGFYEGMDKDDIMKTESYLSEITKSMDVLNYRQKNLGSRQVLITNILYGNVYVPDDYNESKESLWEKMKDAVAKLEDFNEQYVPDDYREAFGKVIKQFQAYNSPTIEGYVPPETEIAQKCERYMKIYMPFGMNGKSIR